YWVAMPTVSMRELTQLDSGKSTMRYLPPKDTAGFAVFCVSAYKREPRPPARIIATISFAITLFSPFAFAPPSVRGENQLCWNPDGRFPPGVRPALFFGRLFRLGLAAPLGGGLLLRLFGFFRLGLLGGRALFHLGLGGPAGRGGLFLTGGLAGGGLFGGGLGLCLVRGGLGGPGLGRAR